MKTLINRFMPVFNSDAGTGGGGAAAGSEPNSGSGAAAGAAAPDGGAGAASPAANAGAADTEWLGKVPENVRGKDARETADNALKALEGYRTRDAERKVPDDAADYGKFEFDKLPDDIRPQIESLAADPLFGAVSAKAKELGVSVPVMQALTAELYAAGAKAGMFADMVDPVAERAALLPAGYEGKPKAEQDAAIDARLKANEDFVNLMVKNSLDDKGNVKPGGLSKADADNLIMWLGTDAAGNRALEFFKAQLTAGGSGPLLGGAGGGGDTRESLKAEMAKPEMTKGHINFNQEKYNDLMGRYQRFFGG